MRRTLSRALILTVVVAAAAEAATFKSTWKSPEAGTLGFAGKKVAAVVLSGDDALRMSAEEALARQLTALGVNGVAAYRVLPREEMKDRDRAQAWLRKVGVEGVVAMRLVRAGTVTTYTPSTWMSPYYSSFWGYYGYTWNTVWDSGQQRVDAVVTVETLVFSVPRDMLLWAAVSETTNPKSMDAFMKDLVSKTVKEMKKAGFTKPGSK